MSAGADVLGYLGDTEVLKATLKAQNVTEGLKKATLEALNVTDIFLIQNPDQERITSWYQAVYDPNHRYLQLECKNLNLKVEALRQSIRDPGLRVEIYTMCGGSSIGTEVRKWRGVVAFVILVEDRPSNAVEIQYLCVARGGVDRVEFIGHVVKRMLAENHTRIITPRYHQYWHIYNYWKAGFRPRMEDAHEEDEGRSAAFQENVIDPIDSVRVINISTEQQEKREKGVKEYLRGFQMIPVLMYVGKQD